MAQVLIIGLGEVGRAHAEVLSKKHEIFTKDIGPLAKFGEEGTDCASGINPEFMLLALNYHSLGHSRFLEIARQYLDQYKPKFLNVLSTVRPGTTAELRPDACHSTTRGLHPNLAEGLRNIAKHVGGPTAEAFARLYGSAGITCVTHKRAIVCETLHLLNNIHYGWNLMFADWANGYCRKNGVDYYDYMRYTNTHNEGFRRLDHARLVRPVLTPPYGRVGGHCIQQGASLIAPEDRGPVTDLLAHYNDPPPKPPVEIDLADKFKAAEDEAREAKP